MMWREFWSRFLSPQTARFVLALLALGFAAYGANILIGREGDRLQLLPLGSGTRQLVVTDPPWAAVAEQLVRRL